MITPIFLPLFYIVVFVTSEAPVHSEWEKQRDRGSASEGERAGTAEPLQLDGPSPEEEEKLRPVMICPL